MCISAQIPPSGVRVIACGLLVLCCMGPRAAKFPLQLIFEDQRERRERRERWERQRRERRRLRRWWQLAILLWTRDYDADRALVLACHNVVSALELERRGDEWELVLSGWIGGRGLAVPAPNRDPMELALPWLED